MKKFFAAAILIAGMSAGSAFAEDRVSVGYAFPDVSYLDGVWAADVEKDIVTLGNVTIVGRGGYAIAPGADFADSAWKVGAAAQLPLSDNLLMKVGMERNLVADVEDVDSYRAGLAWVGDKWRFAGDIVKVEGITDPTAELTAERKVIGDFAVGVGAEFDKNDYYASKLFVAYSF